MKKIVKFNAGFDRRDPDPKKNYGIHGLEITFVLKNYKGAVHFILYTNWLPTGSPDLKWFEKVLPTETSDHSLGPMFVTLLVNPFIPSVLLKPLPVDLGYHSPKPKYEEQMQGTDKCEYLGGKPCYYDGSGLNTTRIFEVLLNEGEEGLWRELQKFHEDVFGESIIKRLGKISGKIINAYLYYPQNLIGYFEKLLKSRKKKNETETQSSILKINGETITLIISVSGLIGTIIAISILLSGGKI